MLGFLAMVTYFLTTSRALTVTSSWVYGGDAERLTELFERVHFDLFFVMLLFLGLAFWLMFCTFNSHGRETRTQKDGRSAGP